jgi:uncharacterized protein YlaN (UPF0358 family)
LAGVIARLIKNLDLDRCSLSDEKHVSNILCGLMREVDPSIIIDGIDLVDEHEVIKQEIG